MDRCVRRAPRGRRHFSHGHRDTSEADARLAVVQSGVDVAAGPQVKLGQIHVKPNTPVRLIRAVTHSTPRTQQCPLNIHASKISVQSQHILDPSHTSPESRQNVSTQVSHSAPVPTGSNRKFNNQAVSSLRTVSYDNTTQLTTARAQWALCTHHHIILLHSCNHDGCNRQLQSDTTPSCSATLPDWNR